MRHPLFVVATLSGAFALSACSDSGEETVERAFQDVNVVDESNLGDVMLTVADPGEAVSYFNRTLKDHPDRIDLRRGLAKSLIRARRNTEGAVAWSRVVAHPEANASDQVDYADALIRTGNWDKAEEVLLTCPAGTRITGKPEMNLDPSGDTSILRFPMSVFTPVPAHSFSGRIAMPGFLTGTGSRYYEPYTVEFDGQVHALMEKGRLTGFSGPAQDVKRAEDHYDYVAELFGIDRNFVHSWHAGIHPGCGYPWQARDNYERWGGAAFGNPRILHFHTCGAYAPGEISWNVIDPSIIVDGVTLWENGCFHAERLPGGQQILDRFPCAAALFTAPDTEIGLQKIA